MSKTTFRIGLDTGGTFIDAVAIASDGSTVAAKSLSGEVAGVLTVLSDLSATLGLEVGQLLGNSTSIVYGTTAGLNALLTRKGAKTGLLTTRGHEDAVLIGRVHQKVAGLTAQQMTNVSRLNRPPPLVPRNLIRGVHERVDSNGREVVRLDRTGVIRAVQELVDAGCLSIAVSFLWSFKNDSHEREARDVIRESFIDLPVTLSVDTAPVLGEYERTATTVVSSYVRPTLERHISALESRLRGMGFEGQLYIMQSNGGFGTVAEAVSSPAVTLGSGPAGGIMAASQSAGSIVRNVISADMGGTSFDVGLIVDGHPEADETPVLDRIHLALPAIKIDSIGAGGGSIAWLDEAGSLRVGPQSAGADPGPACYGRGGLQATVTDADLLLGRLNPGDHPDASLKLDRAAAEAVITELAAHVGVEPIDAAIGLVKVADAQMADLIRKATLESGHDPRDFTLIAYGGAGPVHVGAYAPDVGVTSALIPGLAAALSAQGLATSTWRKVYAESYPARLPVPVSELQEAFDRLESEARTNHGQTGFQGEPILNRTIDLRYSRQTHVVKVPFPAGAVREPVIDRVVDAFTQEYDRIFGSGTGYQEAGVELVAIGLIASWLPIDVRADPTPYGGPVDGAQTFRSVHFDDWVETPELRLEHLSPRTEIAGPAVIDGTGTTLVVHPGQRVLVHPQGLLELTWDDQ